MTNRAQGLRAYFDADGVEVRERSEKGPSDAWRWRYTLRELGRGESRWPVVAAEPKESAERIEYARGEVTEWYRNSPAGIEQGFDLPERPEGLGPLVLSGRVLLNEGTRELHADRITDDEVVFASTSHGALEYGDLHVRDAVGRDVPAEMRWRADVFGGLLELVIHDDNATFPLHVDPLLTAPTWTAEANQAGAELGEAVETAGDVNADGFADVIIGARYYDSGHTDEGRVYVYHGSATGLPPNANWTAEGGQAGALFGASVATAGDLDGDGYADVVIGAPLFDNGESDEGAAFVYRGGATGLEPDPHQLLESDQAGAQFGTVVSTAGDVDGDRYSDVVVTAPYFDGNQIDEGLVYVYHGSTTGLQLPPWTAGSGQASSELGLHSAATGGDINGDGFSDLLVGCHAYDDTLPDEGAMFVFHGSATGLPPTPNQVIPGGQAGASLGSSTRAAGDVNGDGYGDVVLGVTWYERPGRLNEGRVQLHLGGAGGLDPSPWWSADGGQDWSHLGTAVAAADVNGDGYSDVMVAAPYFDGAGGPDTGRVDVYHGGPSPPGATPDWSFEADQPHARLGWWIASAGDVNGDGFEDVIVSAHGYDNGHTDEGRVYVFHGSCAGLAPTANWTVSEASQEDASFGQAAASAGDVNGDGYADVVIGAASFDSGQLDEGRAFLYCGGPSGLATTPAWTTESDQTGAHYGGSVGSAGDVNGDGFADVIVGADEWDALAGADEGRAYVYCGSDTGLSPTPDWTLEGTQNEERLGLPVASAGDVNGDGFGDVLVSARRYDGAAGPDCGRVYVFHGNAAGLAGSAAWIMEGSQALEEFGAGSASAGDLNGDGFSEVVIAAPNHALLGRIAIYPGGSQGLLSTPAHNIEGTQAGARFGSSVATAGDVNGDGFADLIVGVALHDTPTQTDGGCVHVFYGGPSGISATPNWSQEGSQASGSLGKWVSTAGDVNGDGFADVIVGEDYDGSAGTDVGRASVFYGGVGGLSSVADWTVEGDQSGAFLGCPVGTAGDVNGDGYADVIVSASRRDEQGLTDAGRVYVYYGGGGGLSLRPRQARADGTAQIQSVGSSGSETTVRLGVLARSPRGRSPVRLQWEVKPAGTPFDGTGLDQSAAWTDSGLGGVELDELVGGLSAGTRYHWRARVVAFPGYYGRWVSVGHGATATADFFAPDLTPPIALCRNLTVFLNATGQATILVVMDRAIRCIGVRPNGCGLVRPNGCTPVRLNGCT